MGNMIEALHEVEADFDNVYGERSRELRRLGGFTGFGLGFRSSIGASIITYTILVVPYLILKAPLH